MELCYGFFITLITIDVVHGILGGHEVKPYEAPFQANYADICGAVVLKPIWALTTAHCGAEGHFIRAGSIYRLGGTKIQIHLHKLHPRYGKQHEFDYDVQLLKLYRPFIFGNAINYIKFCSGDCGKKVTVFGWGYSEEKGDYRNTLQKVELDLLPQIVCQGVNLSWYNHTLTTRMICAGGWEKDACQGDSGGAAISSGFLVGITSFGFGCGRNIPGVYTNVTHFNIKNWIEAAVDGKRILQQT